jgi:hypothetical protein
MTVNVELHWKEAIKLLQGSILGFLRATWAVMISVCRDDSFLQAKIRSNDLPHLLQARIQINDLPHMKH